MSATHVREHTPTSSGRSTPTPSPHSYMSSSLTGALAGFLRRLSSDTHADPAESHPRSARATAAFSVVGGGSDKGADGVYTPPYRSASPFKPPPLSPLALEGFSESTALSAQLLNTGLAEEIRLLVPPRLQLCDEWNLVYSLEQDGVSLATLYKKCENLRGLRNGFVLVVKDGEGDLFGAYLTEAPHPYPHYFGTGECFLWRASILSSEPPFMSSLPPPPSSDTTSLLRTTTILTPPTPTDSVHTDTSTPENICFKAFPYSGVNDYMMLCDSTFLSVGGGDGHYGLWLDSTFEKGISSQCMTFGNEPLSGEGEKFDILGVEVWTIGNVV